MSEIFPVTDKSKGAVALHALSKKHYGAWLKKQPASIRNWLELNRFSGDAGSYCLLPAKDGTLDSVVTGIDETPGIWSLAHLTMALPAGSYTLEGKFTAAHSTQMALGWALAAYEFTRYKNSKKKPAILVAPKGCDVAYVKSMTGATNWARDMINTPANDMDPAALAGEAIGWAKKHKASIGNIIGDTLLTAGYPMIYHVGKASSVAPRLIDLRFGRKGAKKVTLVGKGVCFDSGGLDIKSAAGMKLMKKDMGGAANVLALARVILETGLNVQLRVLLPIVENAVSGNAMRPLDIVPTRKGVTVEIGNTDAEGRLILCDALWEADHEKPDLLIDFATLTGAARVALGTEVPAFFTTDDALAQSVAKYSESESDPLWRLPLWKNYRSLLDTNAADLSNDPDSSYGGAITAALYLKEFVEKTHAWLHVDMMAWNASRKPGRPVGGEAMAIRALYALIRDKFA